jgi:hypothetical protein
MKYTQKREDSTSNNLYIKDKSTLIVINAATIICLQISIFGIN